METGNAVGLRISPMTCGDLTCVLIWITLVEHPYVMKP
jgi:hypothetical protein